MYRSFGKRIFDLVLTIPGLVIVSPVLTLVALLVRFRLGSPVLFRQQRAGFNGTPFVVLKFRTMTDARDSHGQLLPDPERLTSFGRFLRKTSLDELPELWNVLVGEMSLVGPRPLLALYLDMYTVEQNRRHEVRPGITGLAQIRGRNALPFSQRLRYDIEYVDNCNFWLDCKILCSTIYLVGFGRLLADRADEHVSVVDDLGLHPETRSFLSQQRRDVKD